MSNHQRVDVGAVPAFVKGKETAAATTAKIRLKGLNLSSCNPGGQPASTSARDSSSTTGNKLDVVQSARPSAKFEFQSRKEFVTSSVVAQRRVSFESLKHPFETLAIQRSKNANSSRFVTQIPKAAASQPKTRFQQQKVVPTRPGVSTGKKFSGTHNTTPKQKNIVLRKFSRQSSSSSKQSPRNKQVNNNKVLSGQETLDACPELLADFEREEIKEYSEIFFIGTQASKLCRMGTTIFDDQRGDYVHSKGEHLAYRYEVQGTLGKGSFGQVLECRDHKLKDTKAIKIIRNKKKFHQQAVIERKVLEAIRKADPDQSRHVIHHLGDFVFREHLCLTFQKYSMNLYEVIKMNQFRGFGLDAIKSIAKQLFTALQFLRQLNIIHCDMKPENILLEFEPSSSKPKDGSAYISLRNGKKVRTNIKVIDFGSSCFVGEQVFTYIQSRFYRAPEVILGQKYSTEIDTWSCGCILPELFVGYPLFPGENEGDQLSCMMEVLGVPPRAFIEGSKREAVFFSNSTGQARPYKNSRGIIRLPMSKSLQIAVGCGNKAFISLLESCLVYDPKKRITPGQALESDFLKE